MKLTGYQTLQETFIWLQSVAINCCFQQYISDPGSLSEPQNEARGNHTSAVLQRQALVNKLSWAFWYFPALVRF